MNGTTIKALRQSMGLSQAKFAKLLSPPVSMRCIQMWESDSRYPSGRHMLSLLSLIEAAKENKENH